MKHQEVMRLIKEAGKKAFFVGQAEDKDVHQIEQQLKVGLPESYKWFLKEYGYGGIGSLEIYGKGLDKIAACVECTNDWRNYGLPNSFVVIEEPGMDHIVCLDTSKLVDGECPVVDWIQDYGVGEEYYSSFIEFFKSRLIEHLAM